MSSALFSNFEPTHEDNKQFTSDLALVLSLTDQQRATLLTDFISYLPERDDVVQKRHIDDTSRRAGLPAVAIRHVYDLVTFFLRQLDDERIVRDRTEQWVEDLEAAGTLSEKNRSAFLEFAETIRHKLEPALRPQARVRVGERGVLPFLDSVGATVELRAVSRKPFKWGTAVNEYEPTIDALVPIISLHLGFDSGEPDEVGFQVSVGLAERLIASLQAALKDVGVLTAGTKWRDKPVG